MSEATTGGSTAPASSGGGFMDMLSMTTPYGAALKLGSEAVGAVLGKTVSATSSSGSSADNSGWNVNFGSGSIDSNAKKADATNWLMIGGALIALAIVVKAWRHS